MDLEKNYYRILQVSEDADGAVIAAAYRALSKRYHPDVAQTGDARLMQIINEAYSVLSDSKLRSEYDRKRDRADDLRDEPRKPTESDDEKELWKLKCELYPEILDEFQSLAGISPTLANTFKLSLVAATELERHSQIASSLRRNYLTRYFGHPIQLQQAGEQLIRQGQRDKAKELNNIVSALGPHLSDDQVDRILRKIDPSTRRPTRGAATTGTSGSDSQNSWWVLYAIVGLIGLLWLVSVIIPKR